MANRSPLDILSSASHLTSLSPDAAHSLNALSFKIASEKGMKILQEEKPEKSEDLFQRLLEKADQSPFMD